MPVSRALGCLCPRVQRACCGSQPRSRPSRSPALLWGVALQSYVVYTGEETGKRCGLVGILFLFLPKKKLAAKTSARHKGGCVPFSALQAGMSVSIFCGAAPLPWAKPVLWSCFFMLLHKSKHAVACGFYCQSTSAKGMVHLLCHGHLDVWLPSFSGCRSAGS